MGRGNRTRLWIALPGGIVINGLLLVVLVLVERAPPVLENPAIITLALERPQLTRPTPQRVRAERVSASSHASGRSPVGSAAVGPSGDLAPGVAEASEIDPVWRVDPRSIERWRIMEGNPALQAGRFYRACKGLSSEHLTDEEKDRCYGGWRGVERPTSARSGDALAKPPASRYDRDAEHQERCRAYRSKRTPGNTTSGSSLLFPGVSDGAPLSEGLC